MEQPVKLLPRGWLDNDAVHAVVGADCAAVKRDKPAGAVGTEMLAEQRQSAIDDRERGRPGITADQVAFIPA